MQHLANHEVHAWGDMDRNWALDAITDLFAHIDGIVHEATHILHLIGRLGEFFTLGIESDFLTVDAVGQRFA